MSSPVVLLVKIADRDESSSTAQSKLVLQWGPLHTSGCTVDPQQNQRGFPNAILQSPHVGVPIGCACHDPVGLWSPVNSCQPNSCMSPCSPSQYNTAPDTGSKRDDINSVYACLSNTVESGRSFTCDASAVLRQLIDLHPVFSFLLVDIYHIVVRAHSNFCRDRSNLFYYLIMRPHESKRKSLAMSLS